MYGNLRNVYVMAVYNIENNSNVLTMIFHFLELVQFKQLLHEHSNALNESNTPDA